MNTNTERDLERRRFDELMGRLTTERVRLNQIRFSYSTITRSRFHALRMLWFSLKQLLGFPTANDVYATWSPGLAFGVEERLQVQDEPSGARPLAAAERALIKLWNERIQARPMVGSRLVSIVIPVHNHRSVTTRCMQSIAETWFDSLNVQFIVVDDGSTDTTADVITRLAGIDYIRCSTNEGFIRACNRGASIADGKYICFLNNDTTVQNGWLDSLVSTAEDDDQVGVVGSKLLYPDGRLQEAGSILWRDATGWNYGRFDRPDDPRYNFVRDVDYVSGAAMLVRSELFEELGGFSERFCPAYYEDADLCFAARQRGYRVVYQPLSEVCHYEGLSSGEQASGVKRFQEINRPKFREKWAGALEDHLVNKHSNVFAGARRQRTGETVLIIDSYVPLYDRESGSQRLLHIVRLLRRLGYDIAFLPDNYAGLQPYTQELQQMGVEVLHHIDGGRTMEDSLDAILPHLSIAWICRPDIYAKYEPLIRRNPATRVIYDTVDLCHVRKRREAELLGTDDTKWEEWLLLEVQSAVSAEATVVVTENEKEALQELGVANTFVVPNVHEVAVRGNRSFEDSSGLLFIGSYNHEPNIDAVTWLCESVMPLVWKRLPKVTVTLLGSNTPEAVMRLRSERVRVTGYIPDVSSFFSEARVFVAPLRFGAGMKGKIGHALSYKLPVVTTPVGAEGLDLHDEEQALVVAANADAFADAIVRLYQDKELWEHLSSRSADAIEALSPDAVQPLLRELLSSVTSTRIA